MNNIKQRLKQIEAELQSKEQEIIIEVISYERYHNDPEYKRICDEDGEVIDFDC